MNYIFDVCLNFKSNIIDFYDWNEEDKILFFIKIPVFKIEDEIVGDIINHKVKIDNKFLKNMLNKSEIYSKNTVKTNKYSCIFTSDKRCIGINIDDNGVVNGKSYLSLEEESEVLEFSKFLKYNILDYKIIKINEVKNSYLTRYDKENISFLKQCINSIKDKDELEYLYYELYEKNPSKPSKIYQKIINVVNCNEEKRNRLLKIVNFVYK